METHTQQTTAAPKPSKSLRRMNAGMALALFAIVAATALVVRSYAATITNRKDTMSNQTTSSGANHEISFNLSGGTAFAFGDVIAVDFPEPDFAESGTWATSDFAFNDSAARTIAGVSYGPGMTTVTCPDIDGLVGVAIDSTTLTFRVMPCGASYVPQPAGSFVTFTIDGVMPGGQLVNPADAGTYEIDLLDAAGDCQSFGEDCSIPVVVIDNANITVSATVVGGGGGGGGGGDNTAPLITNVHVDEDSMTPTTADVCWDTNEIADSTVNYGLTGSYGSQETSPGLVMTRCETLTGLTEGQTYHYQVCSKDAFNNQTCESGFTFTLEDMTPPIISGASSNVVSCSSATISWTTNEPSTSYVEYGPNAGPSYPSIAGNDTLVTSHGVSLTGLTPGATYHFRARSGDTGDNESFTLNASFSLPVLCTADVTAPIISNVVVSDITSNSARICWDTNELADGQVDYGSSAAHGLTANSSSFVMTRCVDLTGLSGASTYHFILTSKDGAGNPAVTTDATFMTLAPAPGECAVDCSKLLVQPYIVNPDGTTRKVGSNFVQVEDVSPTLRRYSFEDKGTDMDFNDVVVEVNHANCSNTVVTAILGDALWHHVIRAEAFLDGVLRSDRVLWSDSHALNPNPQAIDFSHAVDVCEGAPLEITNVRVTEITASSAVIRWDTLGRLTNSKVDYGLTSAYGTTATNSMFVTEHALPITGLTKGTTYHYSASSTDSGGASAASVDLTFTTIADLVAPANVTGLTATPGDAKVTLSWANPPDADFQGTRLVRSSTGYPANANDGVTVYDGTGTSFEDTTVTNGVTYYYAAFAHDDVPNYASGALANATPTGAADVTPPGNVTGLSAVAGDAQVSLSWNNPSAPDFAGVKLVRKIGSAPSGVGDGTLVYQGTGTAFLDTGVVNGTHYFYGVFSYDAVPNHSSGAFADATPSAAADVTPPGSVTNLVAEPGDAQVLLTWTNPIGDWAGTRVVRTTGSAPTGPDVGMIVFEGVGSTKMDNFVTNGTRYYYAAYAYDPSLNYAPAAFADATPKKNLPPPEGPRCSDTDGGRNYSIVGTTAFESSTETDSCKNSSTVIEYYCEDDHKKREDHDCGAGMRCSAGSCVPEEFVPVTESCGNSQCAANENSLNCPVDCPVLAPEADTVPVPPVTVDQGIKLHADSLRFYATSGKIQLRLQNGIDLQYYASSVFTVMIPDPSIKKPIKEAFVNFDGSSYRMAQTASFEASVITPAELSSYPLEVIVHYEDGTTDSSTVNVVVVRRPIVYEDVSGTPPVSGARVTLLVDTGSGNFGVWNAATFGQQNPQDTDGQGRFGFTVPIGSYKLVAEKEGYHTKTTLAFPVDVENVVTTDLALIKLPPPGDAVAAATFAAKVAAEAVKEAFQNEYVKQNAENIAAPAATVATVANVATVAVATATALPYAMSVYSFFAHPFLLIGRRRRKQWGVVYNSLSKLPIDLAIVRLIDVRTGRILRSAVTDKEGRYFFIVQPGAYRMVAVKAGFVFPSDILRGQKEDAKYVDLYHGEAVEASVESTITANIPLDPLGADKIPQRVVLSGIVRRFQKALGVFAILAMIVAVALRPTWTMAAMLAANVVLFLVFRRLSVTAKPKNWGIVYDEASSKPVGNVVARIFDSRFNKLLETQVTDSRGRYAFLVGENVYYVTFEKPGYQKTQKGPVDLIDTKKSGMHVVAVDVPLARGSAGAGGAPGAGASGPGDSGPVGSGGSGAGPVGGGTGASGAALHTPVAPLGGASSGGVAAAGASAALAAAAPSATVGAAPAAVAAPAPTPAKPVDNSAAVDGGESYQAKMMARLNKGAAAVAAPAVPVELVAPVAPLKPAVDEPKITVMPDVGKPGDAKAKPSGAVETPQQLVQDIKNEQSGADNGRLLPEDCNENEKKKT